MENPEKQDSAAETKHLSWRTPEYVEYEKTPDWFWGIGIIAFSLAILSVINSNILFALFIILGTVTFFVYALKKPRVIDVLLDERGISIGDTLFPYTELESFWITDDEHSPVLITKTSHPFRHPVAVAIKETAPESVRIYLKKYLPEVELREPISHTIMEYIGF